MKIDVCSDLHIDNWWHTTKLRSPDGPKTRLADGKSLYVDWDWYRSQNNNGDVLVIAGDSSNDLRYALATLEHASAIYSWVVYLDGNHEHYNLMPYSGNMNWLISQCASLHNVAFLCPSEPVFTLDQVAFVGLNGWYDWSCHTNKGVTRENAYDEWKIGLNDFPMIQFDEGDPSVLARQHVDILKESVDSLQTVDSISNIVMVTHSCPRSDLLVWTDNPEWNRLTPSFVNSQMSEVLGVDVNKKISHWLFGHTHTRYDDTIEGVRYINNCRGYPRELDSWSLKQFEV